jgi:hypothetical protein
MPRKENVIMFGLFGKKNDGDKRKQAETLTGEGNALAQKGQFDAALAKFLESAKADPTYFHAYNNIGNCYREKDQNDQAIQAYTQALDLAPDFPQSRYNRAVTYSESGKLKEALSDFQTLQKQGGDKKLNVENAVNTRIVVLGAQLRVSDRASSEFAALCFAKSSSLPERKHETAVATAASASGLAMLRQAIRVMKIDMSELIRTKPGSPVLVDKVNEYGPEIIGNMSAFCVMMGINPSTGWSDSIAEEHKPAQSPAEMAHNIEETFIAVANKHNIQPDDHALLGAIAAVKLIKLQTEALNPELSKALIVTSMVAASKSIPFN